MLSRMAEIPRRVVLALASLGVVVVVAVAGYFALLPKPGITAVNINSEQVAIRGYDPVAYFTEAKATKGSSEFGYVWQGAHWHFASADNRDMFAANPDRYAPRYGGYCSMGLAMGEFSDADPEIWTIVDGKLYLNRVDWVQDMWRKAPDAYITTAEINWEKNRDKLRINDNLR